MGYLLLGYGIANKAIVNYFKIKNIHYIIYDDVLLEYKKDIDYSMFKTIIKSSGIANDHQIIKKALRLNKKVISDLELFYILTFQDKRFITVTGTNGKTTTSALIAHFIKTIDLGGNIGKPLFDFINSPLDIVIEASSYMLDSCLEFKSHISVILNITPHHLSYHKSFRNYVKAKLKLIKYNLRNDIIIYNYDDLLLRRLLNNCLCQTIPFSLKEKIKGCYYYQGNIYYYDQLIIKELEIYRLETHNIANLLASVAAVLAYNQDFKDFSLLIGSFKGYKYRIEYLGEIDDVMYYNDSKATNYAALGAALSVFKNKRVLLICGGAKEEGNINCLDNVLDSLHLVITNGENRRQLNKYFNNKGIRTKSYPVLINALNNIELKEVDIVLFSPGAPSFDQFNNYIERGEAFNNWFYKK